MLWIWGSTRDIAEFRDRPRYAHARQPRQGGGVLRSSILADTKNALLAPPSKDSGGNLLEGYSDTAATLTPQQDEDETYGVSWLQQGAPGKPRVKGAYVSKVTNTEREVSRGPAPGNGRYGLVVQGEDLKKLKEFIVKIPHFHKKPTWMDLQLLMNETQCHKMFPKLGVIVYVVWCAAIPFFEAGEAGVRQLVPSHAYGFVPANVRKLIERFLHSSPQQRLLPIAAVQTSVFKDIENSIAAALQLSRVTEVSECP
ncbi:hypothetical protein BESB_026480 [Besnoitia besnoiti]|uniref:Uncharacterized protein n=1 Tax=Besnoitia besnoiti TaxID=94643 RepID=A0A2A9M375_BESBE|nr:uncharacterized protein BESB_026480 [Besnoitia besnoiti]PFH31674.1 hypothetical protein BESB_026480 [Besnoitia besnoiti]